MREIVISVAVVFFFFVFFLFFFSVRVERESFFFLFPTRPVIGIFYLLGHQRAHESGD